MPYLISRDSSKNVYVDLPKKYEQFTIATTSRFIIAAVLRESSVAKKINDTLLMTFFIAGHEQI